MSKKIVLTGGGTAGHVTPNIALLPFLEKEGFEVSYIGSYHGIEKRLIEDFHLPYYGISLLNILALLPVIMTLYLESASLLANFSQPDTICISSR